MSTFGDHTARQEILDALEYTVAKQAVHPLVFIQLVLEVVANMAEDFAYDKGVHLEHGRSLMIRTVIDGEYVDASPYIDGERKEV